MAYQTPLTVKETLERAGQGRLVLPAIQREFVWATDTDRMTRLFDSLLRSYPIGTFLFWDVPAEKSQDFDFYDVMRVWHERDQRHNTRAHFTSPRDVTAVLDGQQRLTTLNIGLHGSIAHRAKYKRRDSANAYPLKYLFVDLLFEPGEDDEDEYRFEFLTPQQAERDESAHWYQVGKILQVDDPGRSIFTYLRTHDLVEDERPFAVLDRLWRAVHQDGVVSAFEERGEKLDRVLDIFVRVNSGGVVLSKSDLLLSVATAQFSTRDAREEVHQLVDELNAEGQGFTVSKDLVLKAGLVLTGISDIGFRVENFTRANMARLEANWDRLANSLRVAVRLLASFGLSADTLPANSVLIPVADYIYSRGHGQAWLDSESEVSRRDKHALRGWVLRTILMPGVWGSGLDQLLRALHREIEESSGAFPVAALESTMARRGKGLAFSGDLIDELLDTAYRHTRTFALLTLLCETVDTQSRFHVDHVFPRTLAQRRKLLSAGVPAMDVDEIRDKVERLPNLQLLHGPVNLDKQSQLPADWIRRRYPEPSQREAILAQHNMLGLPESFTDFLPYYERRREALRSRLTTLLGESGDEQGPSPTASRPAAAAARGDGSDRDDAPISVRSTGVPKSDRVVTPGSARSRTHYKETLHDLIADGRLVPGQWLRATHHGQEYVATIEASGMRFDGHVFDHPTPAALVITNGVSVNGWSMWKTAAGTEIGPLRNN